MAEDILRSPDTWALALTAACIVGPYVLGVRPRTEREWMYIAVAIAFIVWILFFMASLRST
jgi:hypothetical protein